MTAHHQHSRRITERIYISGQLKLLTPAHFGNGEVRGDALVDMTLLLDEVDRVAMIPGTSIAGALRNYLRERMRGYHEKEAPEDANSPVAWLFGPVRESKSVEAQSLLIVDDALGAGWSTTLRDGVRIEPTTNIAWMNPQTKQGGKFDIELLEAGTVFDLNFELALTKKRTTGEVLPYLVTALEGFERGEIRLGARKRRGYGTCMVESWTVSRFRVADSPAELYAWLETPPDSHRPKPPSGKIGDLLGKAAHTDKRKQFTISATFSLDRSSVLIRSGFGQADVGPDMDHLHARKVQGERWPIISGTSWAGVLRHRAMRIAKTIAFGDQAAMERADEVVRCLYGWMPEGEEGGWASRVTTDETQIENGQSLYQTRVRIDRFTGGAFDGALYEQAPVYGKPGTTVGFHLHVRDPKSHEIGLLLLVLKDLWTSDLPVGGEASVGRGRLQGLHGTLGVLGETLELRNGEAGLGLQPAQQARLQGYVDALQAMIKNGEEVQL